MYNLRLSRLTRLTIGGAALTITASAGVVTLQATAASAVTTSTAPLPSVDSTTSTTLLAGSTPSSATAAAPGAVTTVTKLTKVAAQKLKAAKAVSVAEKQVGDPYRWGATGPNAFDCSGLVQYSWRKAGVKIPRVTYSQYSGIRKKISIKDLRPGDLLFFYGKGHVGMYVGDGKIIHSPNSGETVRIVKLSTMRSSFSGAVRPGL
ncbi:hypothetical protein Misp01_56640 [Microtetraspora sp. NBRC 13810]|uniref:C40 family peptidase n=1 Tax=Microtetraspora sp. NBRC 13810 TaxID=3030990 RepID=UPI0024A2350C|nr:C40 family peptidase [Microtetraspora sp. NBRC 13810]GLW10536.1 hypothetical protein Misp01_56640 [Microtetraspora sp. NBRC 13810]